MRTQQEINKAIDSFEQEVKAQLALGLKPNEAVRNAYAKYPVMDMMKATLQAELVNTFMAGYGDNVPYSAKSISQAMSESWASDDLTLSKRLYRRSSTIRNEVADTIKQALKTNKTVKGLAKSIFDGYGKGGIIPEASIPKFLRKLADINISGEATPEAKRKQRELLRSVKGKIARLDTPYVRAAYNEVAAAFEDGNEVRLQKAIYTATQEKARYHAERIARTENARAYADGQINRYLDDEDVVAFQWKLSANHPRYDICDFYANADLYGLGKGVYPKDKFPNLPAHPHCMCHIRPMTELDIDVNKRHNNLEQSGLEYIKSLSKQHQEVLLGVNGRNTVLSGKGNWQNFVRGWTDETFNVRNPNSTIKRLHNSGVNGLIKLKGNDKPLFDLQLFSNNEIDFDKIIDKTKGRYKIKTKSNPNDVVMYKTKNSNGQQQLNFSFYNEFGILYKQLHGGHHGNAKHHNVGTNDNPIYHHKHFYKIVGYKNQDTPILEESEIKPLTEKEKGYFNDERRILGGN